MYTVRNFFEFSSANHTCMLTQKDDSISNSDDHILYFYFSYNLDEANPPEPTWLKKVKVLYMSIHI